MYQHTQTGWTIIILFIAVALGIGITNLSGNGFVLFFAVSGFLVLLGLLFGSMTIKVDEKSLKWHFGPGFWKKEIPLENIAGTEEVTNKWYYGWGIRYTPYGWLYNVSGLSAVEVRLRSGKNIRLGTDEPTSLKQAIDSRCKCESNDKE